MPANRDELAGIYRWGDLYEDIYIGRGKDYQSESAKAAGVVKERCASATSLLDVACGTGSHLRHLQEQFGHVEGIDLAEEMIASARAKLPEVPFHVADMREFDLGRRFDAVICMFSSIGYLDGEEEIKAAIACLARHLEPGGVLVLEPWFFPETALDQHVTSDLCTVGERTISRVSRAVVADGAHRLQVHYTVAEPASGIHSFVDEHVLAVVERGCYEDAFKAAGCSVEYLEGAPGLFVGVREDAPATPTRADGNVRER